MKREIISAQRIAQRILYLRGQKVMLSQDLASLYGVSVGALTQAVKRNATRFPKDFVFQLSAEEFTNLKSQFVISSWGGLRSRPYAFTEQGVAMLSSVLNSERAVKVNIAIMRAFVKLRETLETSREFARKFSELEKRVGKHDDEIGAIIDAIRQLMAPPKKPAREIGFHVRERSMTYRIRKRQ
ncbi:MAG: DNA-binding protein [Verrucomicrobia bacterium]|nr:MAG: DNA-binding protein [Verrucomicrobiota bacterium]HTD87704.1 ORF6N domain-containing protein [Candidatus Binatia bacterium]